MRLCDTQLWSHLAHVVSRDLVPGSDVCHDPVLTFDTVPVTVLKCSGYNALVKHE